MSDPKVVDIQVRLNDLASSGFAAIGGSLEKMRDGVDSTAKSLGALEKVGKISGGIYMAADALQAFDAGLELLKNYDGQNFDVVQGKIDKFKATMSSIPVVGKAFTAGSIIGEGLFGDRGVGQIREQTRLIQELMGATKAMADGQRKAWQDLNSELVKSRFELEQTKLAARDPLGLGREQQRFDYERQMIDTRTGVAKRDELSKIEKEFADRKAAAQELFDLARNAQKQAQDNAQKLPEPLQNNPMNKRIAEENQQRVKSAQAYLQMILNQIDAEKQARLGAIDEISKTQRAKLEEEFSQFIGRTHAEFKARQAQLLMSGEDAVAAVRERARQQRLEQEAREQELRNINRYRGQLSDTSIARGMRLQGRPLDASIFEIGARYRQELEELDRIIRDLPIEQLNGDKHRALQMQRNLTARRQGEEEEDAAREYLQGILRPTLAANRGSRFLTGVAESALDRQARENGVILRDVRTLLQTIKTRLDQPISITASGANL